MILSRYLVAPVEPVAEVAGYSVFVEVAVAAVYFVEFDLEIAQHSVGSDLLRTEHPFSASLETTCHRTLSKSRNSDSVDTLSKSGRSICYWVVRFPVVDLEVAADSVAIAVLGSAAPVADLEVAADSVAAQLSVIATVPVNLLPH